MRQVEPQPGDSIGPLDWYKIIPFEPAACERPAGVGRPGGSALSCDACL